MVYREVVTEGGDPEDAKPRYSPSPSHKRRQRHQGKRAILHFIMAMVLPPTRVRRAGPLEKSPALLTASFGSVDIYL
jgi:hypothetical protein